MKLFLDSDVIIDFLLKRTNHNSVAQLFDAAETGMVQLVTSPVIIANVYYIVCKHIGNSKTLETISKLHTLLGIVEMGETEVELALHSTSPDFEDSLQYFSAIRAHAHMIVSRNGKDYPVGELQVVTPSEAAVLLLA